MTDETAKILLDLATLGYSLHLKSSDEKQFGFTNIDDEHKPYIQVNIFEGVKTMKLTSSVGSLFMHISTGNIQYMHPRLNEYISAMTHYTKLCSENKWQNTERTSVNPLLNVTPVFNHQDADLIYSNDEQ